MGADDHVRATLTFSGGELSAMSVQRSRPVSGDDPPGNVSSRIPARTCVADALARLRGDVIGLACAVL